MKKLIITACDINQEDILLWWIDNTRKHTDVPIRVYDIGLSRNCIGQLTLKGVQVEPFVPNERLKAWFNKPFIMNSVEDEDTTVLWLDIDCELVSSIDDIWNLAEDDTMLLAPDPVIRQQGKVHNMNTGVALYRPGEILKSILENSWWRECVNPKYGPHNGDQDALYEQWMRNRHIQNQIHGSLPQKFNNLRLMFTRGVETEDTRIRHWTGATGKNFLRNKIIPNFYLERKAMGSIGHDYRPEDSWTE